MKPGSYNILHPSWSRHGGLVEWENKNGFHVLQIHYSADPAKDANWAESASKRYPGGLAGGGWRREMELDWTAGGGQLIYPDFAISTHVIQASEYDEGLPSEWAYFRIIDPGFTNPTCCLICAVDGDGTYWVCREYYVRQTVIADHAQAIKAMTGRTKIQYTIMDHRAFDKNLDGGGSSIAEQFSIHGIVAVPGDRRWQPGVERVRELLKIQEWGEPRLKVLDCCPNTIWEFGRYRTKEISSTVAIQRGPSEEPIKKDDHTMDCIRWFAMAVPEDFMGDHAMADPYKLGEGMYTRRQRRRAEIKKWRERGDGDDWD